MAPRTSVAVPNREARCHPDSDSLPPDLINVPEAARRCGLNAETLYRLIRAGNFPPAVHFGRGIRISVPRLENFLHGDANAPGVA
jgi:excisionase family DNA binding protein